MHDPNGSRTFPHNVDMEIDCHEDEEGLEEITLAEIPVHFCPDFPLPVVPFFRRHYHSLRERDRNAQEERQARLEQERAEAQQLAELQRVAQAEETVRSYLAGAHDGGYPQDWEYCVERLFPDADELGKYTKEMFLAKDIREQHAEQLAQFNIRLAENERQQQQAADEAYARGLAEQQERDKQQQPVATDEEFAKQLQEKMDQEMAKEVQQGRN
eukprot:TRINITY_DN53977_c0_g1_i1.p1 TRINITY_DN53977_c0_g1~~TRINITY_DN53977_c0_g1_i1.p1  ORF type:complete len:224 (-),score=44.59 TRINITY_DN53977_c0_g1_i1:22-663(-)